MENEINGYVSELLTNVRFKKREYRKFYDKDYELPPLTGKLEASTAIALLKKALKNKKLRNMTHSLLYFCDADTVTVELFGLLDRFPRKTRYSYYSSLAHCDLSFTQLWCINEREGTEAFEDLFYMICKQNVFSVNDMRMLLENANYTKNLLKACIEYAESKYGGAPKIEFSRKYL